MIKNLYSLFLAKNLLWLFTKRDITTRFSGTILGIVWSFIQPLNAFLVYLLVFGFFIKIRLPGSDSLVDYIVYFSAGFFPWIFFNTALIRSSTTIIDNRNYIKKVPFPSEIFPFSVIVSEAVTLGISLLIVLGFSVLTERTSMLLFLLPVIVFIHLVFTLALGLLFSAVSVFFRDLPHALQSFFMVWFWLTPITYPSEIVPEKMRVILQLNPMHHIIALYREIFFHSVPPNAWQILFILTCSMALLACCWMVFGLTKKKFSELL